MFAEVAWFPQAASTTARDVDWFLLFLVIVCGSVGLMVAVLMIAFAIRYRRRGERQSSAGNARQPSP